MAGLSGARLAAVALKETRHVFRDFRALLLALGLPLFLVWLFGYALTLDVDQVPTIVLDQDRTAASRAFISRLDFSPYFNLLEAAGSPGQLGEALRSGRAMIALEIPAGFGAAYARDDPGSVQVLLDGTNSQTASLAQSYVEALVKAYSFDQARRRLSRLGLPEMEPPVEVRSRIWFNEDAKSKNYIVPGIIAVIIMILTAQLTSLTVAREWETGTLEWLIATPVTPAELILGKLLPYVGIGLVDVVAAVGAGVFLFDVPFRGSFWLLLALSSLFLVGVLAMGLFISVAAKSQLLAAQVASLTTFLPSFLLSGFIYPIYNMPRVLQAITYLVPARYYMTILKGVFLKGIGFDILVIETLLLAGFAGLMILGAVKRFRTRLEV